MKYSNNFNVQTKEYVHTGFNKWYNKFIFFPWLRNHQTQQFLQAFLHKDYIEAFQHINISMNIDFTVYLKKMTECNMTSESIGELPVGGTSAFFCFDFWNVYSSERK